MESLQRLQFDIGEQISRKEYLRRKYTLVFANATGAVPGITNMNLAPMSEILDTISRNYDLVGIEIWNY